MTPEINAQVPQWRARAIAGDLTLEEMRQAVVILRSGRLGAAKASDGARRARAKAEIPSADDLLAEMGDDA